MTKETARNLHASSATTFSSFIQSLKTYESARSDRDHEAAIIRTQVFEELQSLAKNLSGLSIILEKDQEVRVDGMSLVENNLREIVRNIEVVLRENAKMGVNSIVDDVREALSRLKEEVTNSFTEVAAQVRIPFLLHMKRTLIDC
jgi:hypothetical protein